MPALELCLPAAELPRLLRGKAFGRRSGRPVAIDLTWHDTGTGALTADRLSLSHGNGRWRLEAAGPRAGLPWSPGMPTQAIAEATELAALGKLPAPLLPIAGFRGEVRTIPVAADPSATVSVLSGTVRGVAVEQPVCRLVLDGPAPVLLALSTEWAASLPVAVSPLPLAMQAMALARGTAAPHQAGAPAVAEGMTVADAMVHIVGHLTEVILVGVAAASAGGSVEPVHVMRVAVRRLRSALSVFHRAAPGPVLEQLTPRVADLAAVLGAARDWDVFLGGTGADIGRAMPDDPRIQAMLAAATRRRDTAYAGLRRAFASVGFRQLSVALAQYTALRPWESEADEEQRTRLSGGIGSFANDSLARQYRHLLAMAPDIDALTPVELHAVRKKGKRLRYTAEFFAPLYGAHGTHRFLRRLSQLQEVLGHLNDGAAAAGLMQALRGGADQHFAAGVVQGFTAARSAGSRAAIGKSWGKLRHAKPFWLRN